LPTRAIPDAEADRADDPKTYSNDKNPGQPREASGNQDEHEMKERFHS
jgi:hypothetical protein